MRTSLTFERYYPLIYGAAAFVATMSLGGSFPESRDGVLSSTISIGAIATGFLGTLKGILMSLPRETIAWLKESGYIEELTRYLSEAIISSLVISAIGMTCYFSIYESNPLTLFSIWLASLIYGACCTYRVSSILMLILRSY